MLDLGTVRPGETLNIPFSTFDSNDPSASVTVTALVAGDIEIYKDGSLTQRASDAGYVVDVDLDTTVGVHSIQIDLADNTTAGFYAAGSEYVVLVGPFTVDAATINVAIARFKIGQPGAVLNTTIATLSTQTSFTLTKGPAENDALNGMWCVIHDVASEVQMGHAVITDYVGSSKTVTLAAGVTFTAVATDNISIMGLAPLQLSSTAAANLGLMYDGTGYTDDTAPASRSQVDSIGAASGGSVNIQATEDNTGGAIKGVSFVGFVNSGTFASTEAQDDVYHDMDDTTDVIDIIYGFDIGGGRTATSVTINADIDDNNDIILIKAFDFAGTDWETIGSLVGSGGNVFKNLDLVLLLKHTGTGSDLGKVYIRFDTDSTTPSNLKVDHLIVSAVNIGQSVGYANGQIWVDTDDGVAGTEDFVNGTADNPCLTWADAQTLATALTMHDFHIINGSTITLDNGITNFSLFGDNWTLILNGKSITGCHFEGATVSGVSIGTGAGFHGGEMGTCTLAGPFHVDRAILAGTITLDAAESEFERCTMSGAPVLEFGNAIGNTTIHMHGYNGAITLSSMGDTGTDVLHIDGAGTMTTDACAGGTVHYRGEWKITDAGGNTTFNASDQRVDVAAILADTAVIGVAGAGLTDLGGMATAMKAEILVEVNAALDTAIAELGVGVPVTTPSIRTALMAPYMKLINLHNVKTSYITDALEVAKADGTIIFHKDITDDATDYSEAKAQSGASS